MKYIGACIARALLKFLIFLGLLAWLIAREWLEEDDQPGNGHF